MGTTNILIALICVSLWGANYTLLKEISLFMSPTMVTAIRLLLKGVTGVGFLKGKVTGQLKSLGMLAVTLFIIALILTSFALKDMDASIISMFLELEVVFVMLIEILVFNKLINKTLFTGLCLALTGVWLVLNSPDVEFHNLILILFAAASSLSIAIASFQVRSVKLPALDITVWSALIGGLMSMGITLFDQPGEWLTLHELNGAQTFLILVSTAFSLVAFLAWNKLLTTCPIQKVSAFTLLIPVATVISSYLYYGTLIRWEAALGGLITILGLGVQLAAPAPVDKKENAFEQEEKFI